MNLDQRLGIAAFICLAMFILLVTYLAIAFGQDYGCLLLLPNGTTVLDVFNNDSETICPDTDIITDWYD